MYVLPKDFPEAAEIAAVGHFAGVRDGHVGAGVAAAALTAEFPVALTAARSAVETIHKFHFLL